MASTWFITLHVLCIIFLGTATLSFMWNQLSLVGFKAAKNNKFVKLSSAGALSLLLSLICYVLFDFSENNSPLSSIWVQNVGNFGFSGSAACHVTLVYLRSKVVFQSVAIHRQLARAVLVSFYTSILTSSTLNAAVNVIASIPNGLLLINAIFSILSALILAVIDVVSTIGFVLHVRNVNSQLKKDNYMKSSTAQTDLIARRGAASCFCSSIGVVLYAIYWSLYTVGWMYLLVQWFLSATMAIWMLMKIELDLMKKAAENSSQMPQKPISSTSTNNVKPI
eukprot:TRINITY_DN10960_c0_g1_i13.p1 TRINITY_DN10960_c0_g1~~TRINITY_DN10960_c0_g1_i13.p1  ORF type:complete len:280 (-),score=65.88 TRINITY_DN10960_c0_g1_i13:66-905(-)